MLRGAANFFLIKLKKKDFSTKKKVLEVEKLKQSLSFMQGIDIGKGGPFFSHPTSNLSGHSFGSSFKIDLKSGQVRTSSHLLFFHPLVSYNHLLPGSLQ